MGAAVSTAYPKWGVIEAQAGGFRNEDRLLGIGVTAAAHGRPDRVHAAKAPQIRCGASRRFRPREPRTERRPEGSYLAPAGYCTGASVEVMICLHITRGMRLGYRCFARRFV